MTSCEAKSFGEAGGVVPPLRNLGFRVASLQDVVRGGEDGLGRLRMGKQKVLARLRRVLGAHAAYEVDPYAPTPKERLRIETTMGEAAADAAKAKMEMEAMSPQGHGGFAQCDPRIPYTLPCMQSLGREAVGTRAAAPNTCRTARPIGIQRRGARRQLG